MRVLIRGGTVATAQGSFAADVLIDGEVIVEVGQGLPGSGARIADASGCLVTPGGVDAHTSFGLDLGFAAVADGFEAGTRAAAMGGVTCVVEEPAPGGVGASCAEQIAALRQRAGGACCIDYAIHSAAWNASPEGLAAIESLSASGHPTVMVNACSPGRLGPAELLRVMASVFAGGSAALFALHCEDAAIADFLAERGRLGGLGTVAGLTRAHPDYAEALGVRQAVGLSLAAASGAQGADAGAGKTLPIYIRNVSSAAGVRAVAEAQAVGQHVTAGTCPQYLLLDETAQQQPGGAAFAASPPLRAQKDRDALWRGLSEGVVSVVASDHRAFSLADKLRLAALGAQACPPGLPGVETRLALLYTFGVAAGRISLERFVEACCTAPARIMGLDRKGRVEPGLDADIAVLDPAMERVISAKTLTQKAGYTPFEGMTARGWPRHVLSRGRLVVEDGRLAGDPGWGRFVPRSLGGARGGCDASR